MVRKLLLISCVCVLTTGCSTVRFFNKDKSKEPTTVCEKIVEPARVPLSTFTFFAIPPAGKVAEGGVQLKAGITEDGMAAILGNLAKLQKRDQEWSGRAKANNDCLDTEAKQRAAKK